MGKQRFRLSHMIPNAWFYRLRDMNTITPTNNKSLPTSNHHPKNSFCYTPKVYSSPSSISRPLPKHALGSIYIRPAESTDHTNDQELFLSPSSSCYESPLFDSFDKSGFEVVSSSTMNVKSEFNDTEDLIEIELHKLPQIITQSKRDTSSKVKAEESSGSIKFVKENIYENNINPRSEKLAFGENTRSDSTKAHVCKRVVNDQNYKFSSKCCLVKSTYDPCKDVKESVIEMIVDYNIQSSQDLEMLLTFYLSLNSNEYHDMIVKVFEEIWLTFDSLV